MGRSPLLALWLAGVAFANSDSSAISKRSVLTDLSGGWDRSYKFGAGIANDVLYMVGLDGGLIPDDGDSTHHYLVTLDLTSSFSVNNGSNYKMTIINDTVPAPKYSTFWASQDNSTMYMYGGLFVGNVSSDTGIWTYSPDEKTWQLQQESIIPTRLVNGAETNAPEIQAAYWVGGYQAYDTTTSITDDTQKDYATGMIQLNTTTGVYTGLEAPFTPVQDGSLSYLPEVGELGVLVFVGGEIPSIQNGDNATLTPNAWDYVQVYDIASAEWYNQTTSGSVPSRTQFCSAVQHDENSGTYEIFVISGANYETEDVLTDVSYLSIPSFKWYTASPLTTGRMTTECAAYGTQIFTIGGRNAWYDDYRAGTYKAPAFIYDADSQALRTNFDPTRTTYTVSSSTYDDIQKSPYPSKWASSSLETLFKKSKASMTNSTSATSTATSSSQTTSPSSKSGHSSTNTAAIAGGVVGGVAGAALIAGLLFFFLKKRRNGQGEEYEKVVNRSKNRVPTELTSHTTRLEMGDSARYELPEKQL